SLRFDWLMMLCCAWLVGGLFLDGWAHNHFRNLETFFTPWHGVLYSGFAASAACLGAGAVRGWSEGRAWRDALPPGYALSLLGVALFLIAGLADMVWHTLLGVEVSIEGLLSPVHLFLAFSGSLILTGPLRSLWRRSAEAPGWRLALPALFSLASL